MSTEDHTTKAIVIAGVEIVQDAMGRYSLNTLHKASGAKHGKQPSKWLDNQTTQELIAELQSQNPNSCFDVVKGGNAPGIYAHALLAVSYAGWISPSFQLRVNQAFLDAVRPPTLPVVKNPSNQMLIESIIRIDALEQVQLAQQAELIATQQKVIEGFLLAQQAHTKAEEAEASAQRAHDARDFFTVAEYMQYEYSEQKIPKREYKAISDHLQAYCLNKGKAYRRIPVGGKPWSEEYAYHRSIYDAALPGWLHRRYAQENLTVIYPNNPDHAGD
jgi:hypothetical protein